MLDLPQEWVGAEDAQQSGIRGALSWQPTICFDDQMWFPYAEAVKNQQLYHPFGTWKETMAVVAADARSSIDRKFEDAQTGRFARDRQQKGNRRRSGEARARRAELLKVALEVWPQVLAQPRSGRGRPARRQDLAEGLRNGVSPCRGATLSGLCSTWGTIGTSGSADGPEGGSPRGSRKTVRFSWRIFVTLIGNEVADEPSLRKA
jgi:hypothetical protein